VAIWWCRGKRQTCVQLGLFLFTLRI
jgi:hypothetical protein